MVNASDSSSSDSDVSTDFLGRPLTHEKSDTPSPSDSSVSDDAEQTIRPSRKQTTPKKRVNRVNEEVRRLQRTTHLLIPRLSFQRLVREILQQNNEEARIQSMALEALQESAELYIETLFEDALLLQYHAKRKTLMYNDLFLRRHLNERRI